MVKVAPGPMSRVPRSCLARSETSCRPSEWLDRDAKSSGRPAPVSLTRRTTLPSPCFRRTTRTVPDREFGKACLRLLVSSSFTIRPQGMAWPVSTSTASRSSSSLTGPEFEVWT